MFTWLIQIKAICFFNLNLNSKSRARRLGTCENVVDSEWLYTQWWSSTTLTDWEVERFGKELSLLAFYCFDSDQKELWRNGIYLTYTSRPQSFIEGSQAPTWYRGNGRMLLPSYLNLVCSICFLIQPRTTAPGWHHPQWAGPPPHKLLIKKIPPKSDGEDTIFHFTFSLFRWVYLVSAWQKTD